MGEISVAAVATAERSRARFVLGHYTVDCVGDVLAQIETFMCTVLQFFSFRRSVKFFSFRDASYKRWRKKDVYSRFDNILLFLDLKCFAEWEACGALKSWMAAPSARMCEADG